MSISGNADNLTVGIAQISPVWLNREATLEKIIEYVHSAGHEGCQILAFGEALLPGYPFWIEHTDGARFNSTIQKEIHAHYIQKNAPYPSTRTFPIRSLKTTCVYIVKPTCVVNQW